MRQTENEPWVRYADRFDPSSWKDDRPVRLWLVDGAGVDDEVLVPETLWDRIRFVGTAYQLHLLPVLDGSLDPVHLNAEQCRRIVDEVDFVTVATDDASLDAVGQSIIRLASRARAGVDRAIGIEFP